MQLVKLQRKFAILDKENKANYNLRYEAEDKMAMHKEFADKYQNRFEELSIANATFKENMEN